MRFGPFWWLEPIEYGFHRSQSTQRPSRPPQTRIIVRSRAIGGRSARAACHGSNAAAPAARPVFRTSRRPSDAADRSSGISSLPYPAETRALGGYCAVRTHWLSSAPGCHAGAGFAVALVGGYALLLQDRKGEGSWASSRGRSRSSPAQGAISAGRRY